MRAGSVTPAAARGSAASAGTFTQRPRLLGWAQYTHLPSQPESQQTPSTQKLESHSLAALQACPSPFLPQLAPWQPLGGTQSAALAQVPWHAPSLHRKGAQLIGEPPSQVPCPSQTLGGMKLPPLHEPSRQMVPTAYLAQPPCPLHAPLDPQLSAASTAHTPCRSGLPTGTGVHWPILPGSAQLTHGPLQATLQQTPSAQKPLSHSPPA